MPERPPPVILVYTSMFGKPMDVSEFGPGAEVTFDRARLAEADAVLFHIPDAREIGDARKYRGQLWVAWSMESRANYPLLGVRDFMRHFDIVMSYEQGADIWTPYLPKARQWLDARQRPVPDRTEDAPAVLFQSSGIDRSGRGRLVAELARHIRIDSYGSFMRNRRIDGPDLGAATKLATISRYRFCLAFENSIAPDYVTEKLFDGFLAGTVPVYLGAPNVAAFAPDHSYIDAADFKSPADLAAHLHHLVRTPDAYAAYLAWRNEPLPERLVALVRRADVAPFPRLVEMIRARVAEGDRVAAGSASFPFGYRTFVRTRLRRWRKRLKGR